MSEWHVVQAPGAELHYYGPKLVAQVVNGVIERFDLGPALRELRFAAEQLRAASFRANNPSLDHAIRIVERLEEGFRKEATSRDDMNGDV